MGPLGTPPRAQELADLAAIRAGTKLPPPAGSWQRRRLDDVEAYLKDRPARPIAGYAPLGSPPTLREVLDLEAIRAGTKVRPPPGTLQRQRLDEVEAYLKSQ